MGGCGVLAQLLIERCHSRRTKCWPGCHKKLLNCRKLPPTPPLKLIPGDHKFKIKFQRSMRHSYKCPIVYVIQFRYVVGYEFDDRKASKWKDLTMVSVFSPLI